MAYLALGRLRPVFDLRQQRRLDPDATVRDFLRIGLGLRISGLSRACKSFADAVSKPWSTLPAWTSSLPLLPGEIKAVPLVAVEREPCDGKRLALGTALFLPNH